jgi:hypothetical protein
MVKMDSGPPWPARGGGIHNSVSDVAVANAETFLTGRLGGPFSVVNEVGADGGPQPNSLHAATPTR